MSFIGANQIEGENGALISIPIEIPVGGSLPRGEDLSNSVAHNWEIDLEYTDVFGQKFVTKHTSDPKARWATFEKLG